jgi:hypothetical protein
MNTRRLNLYAFLIAISIITYGHVKRCRELPWPPQYIYTALVFGLLDIFSIFNEEIAGVTSIGFVIAITVGTLSPEALPGQLQWSVDCEHGGTGQPGQTAYIGSPQPPSAKSLEDYQTQTGQSGTTGQGGNVVV